MVKGERVLEHRSRKLILNYIKAHPGESFGTLKRIFEMNDSTLKYHLKYLERAKKVVSRREGRRRCYYPGSEGDVASSRWACTTEKDLPRAQQRTLTLIKANPGITSEDIHDKLDMSKQVLNKALRRLQELRLIWVIGRGERTGYEYITEERLKAELFNHLVKKLLDGEIDEETFLAAKRKLKPESND